jgi:cytochrome c oxidase cbb3-type subunit III
MRAPGGLGSVGVTMLLACGLVGCDILPGKPSARAGEETSSAQVMSFDALYGRQCAGCHGRVGHLGAARPLNDPVYLALVPAARLRQIIAEGVPGTAQPAFATSAGGALTDAQIDALVQGVVGAWARSDATQSLTIPPYAAKRGDPERGSAVYAVACAGCHGADGRGGPEAGSIADPSYLALVSDQHLRTTVIAGRADLGMPDWRGYIPGRALAPEEVSDVVAWLVAQRAPIPGRAADVSIGRQGADGR